MKQNLTLFLILLSLIGCQHEKLYSIEPTDPEYLSIESSEELQDLYSNLMNGDQSGRIENDDQDLIRSADWNKVRKIMNEDMEYKAFGMVLKLENDAAYSNLLLIEHNEIIEPFIFSFFPNDQWYEDPESRRDNPLNGTVSFTSLINENVYSSAESSINGRVNSTYCYTIWIEVNNNYIDSDGTVVVMPHTLYPVTICETSGGDIGGKDGGFFDGIEDGGGGAPGGETNDRDPELPVVQEVNCLSGQELVNGICQPVCAQGWSRDESGTCREITNCNADDEIINAIQDELNELWKSTNVTSTQTSMDDRLENGGWIVQNGSSYDYIPFPSTWQRTPCGINPPRNWSSTIPSNVVGWVHTHPFYLGEDRRSICGYDKSEEQYLGAPSDEDYLFLNALQNATGNFSTKAYVIDGSLISSVDFLRQVKKHNRCGY